MKHGVLEYPKDNQMIETTIQFLPDHSYTATGIKEDTGYTCTFGMNFESSEVVSLIVAEHDNRTVQLKKVVSYHFLDDQGDGAIFLLEEDNYFSLLNKSDPKGESYERTKGFSFFQIEKTVFELDLDTKEVIAKAAKLNDEILQFQNYIHTLGASYTRVKTSLADAEEIPLISMLEATEIVLTKLTTTRKYYKELVAQKTKEREELITLHLVTLTIHKDGLKVIIENLIRTCEFQELRQLSAVWDFLSYADCNIFAMCKEFGKTKLDLVQIKDVLYASFVWMPRDDFFEIEIPTFNPVYQMIMELHSIHRG